MTDDARRLYLLRQVVPAALAESRLLARANREGELTSADLLSNEARLRDLIVDVATAHRSLSGPTGLRTEEYEILSERGGEEIVAYAPMAFCPESVFIVHAPIMLGRVHAIVERLLPDGAVPVALERVRIRRPITQDLEIAVALDGVPAGHGDAPLTGTMVDSGGRRWRFAGRPMAGRPVTRWIDNREVDEVFEITADPVARTRRFRVAARGTGRALSRTESVQLLLEAILRAVARHRTLDGRAILIGGIRRIAWPPDLADRLAGTGTVELTATPGDRIRSDGPWHRLRVDHAGSLCEGVIDDVEGHTALTALFA